MNTLAEELIELRELYVRKTEAQEAAKDAAARHKKQEQQALSAFQRAGEESSRPTGLGYTFTAVTDQEKGRITDRKVYYRWALEREPSIQEFLENAPNLSDDEYREALYEAVENLTILKLSEQQRVLNATVKRCHDDEEPLPPGMDFEPVPYVSVTKA